VIEREMRRSLLSGRVRPLEYNREFGQTVQVCERFLTTLLRLSVDASAIEKFTGRIT
jgi:hypothetical protein